MKNLLLSTRIIFKAAVADLCHERIMSICQVLAIAAIFIPIILMHSLRQGTISTLRSELVDDPVFRQIRSAETVSINHEFVARLNERSDVDFVVPTMTRGASVVRIGLPKSSEELTVDLRPTAPGDPLLLENGVTIPGKDSAVLSKPAADKLGIEANDRVEIRISRDRQNVRETETLNFHVLGVLDYRADSLPRIYVPLQLARDIETYRYGIAVSDRNWEGSSPDVPPSFDGAFIASFAKISDQEVKVLSLTSALPRIEASDSITFKNKLGITAPQNAFIYHAYSKEKAVGEKALNNLQNNLRPFDAIIFPYTKPKQFNLSNSTTVSAIGVGVNGDVNGKFEPPDWMEDDFPEFSIIVSPKDRRVFPDLNRSNIVDLNFSSNHSDLSIPVGVYERQDTDRNYLPLKLAGRLRTASERTVIFDPTSKSFQADTQTFHGFRIYARNIDVLQNLVKHLENSNFAVDAKISVVERLKALDKGLMQIFSLIAGIGLLGGLAVLIASLYATVQRKVAALATFRMLGLSRRSVAIFPVVQAILLSILGAATAIGISIPATNLIRNVVFSEIERNSSTVFLTKHDLVGVVLISIAVALISSLIAVIRCTQITPAEGIREE